MIYYGNTGRVSGDGLPRSHSDHSCEDDVKSSVPDLRLMLERLDGVDQRLSSLALQASDIVGRLYGNNETGRSLTAETPKPAGLHYELIQLVLSLESKVEHMEDRFAALSHFA